MTRMGHCQLMGETPSWQCWTWLGFASSCSAEAVGHWQISFRKSSFTGNMSWIYHILWMKAILHQLKNGGFTPWFTGFLPSKVVQDFFHPPYVIQSLLSPIVFPYENPLRSGKSMENSCEAGVFHAMRPTWRADVIHLFLKWIYNEQDMYAWLIPSGS